MFKRILVAVDGSPTAERGLMSAIDLAADQHAMLIVLHVIDDRAIVPTLHGALRDEFLDRMIESVRAAGDELIAKAEGLARERGVEVRRLLIETLEQSVAQTILAQARKHKADIIVLGTHGRRGVRRLLMGSDAETVLRESPVPILLVRMPEGAKPHVNSVKQRGWLTAVRPDEGGRSHLAR